MLYYKGALPPKLAGLTPSFHGILLLRRSLPMGETFTPRTGAIAGALVTGVAIFALLVLAPSSLLILGDISRLRILLLFQLFLGELILGRSRCARMLSRCPKLQSRILNRQKCAVKVPPAIS